MENSMEVSQKIKIKLPCDPAIPLFGIYMEKTKTLHCSIIYNNEHIETTKVSINKWMDRDDVVYNQ